jgi:hypothetical protein
MDVVEVSCSTHTNMEWTIIYKVQPHIPMLLRIILASIMLLLELLRLKIMDQLVTTAFHLTCKMLQDNHLVLLSKLQHKSSSSTVVVLSPQQLVVQS